MNIANNSVVCKSEIQKVVTYLTKLGIPALPVAPYQPGSKFSGKNPSYLDAYNKPHLIPHSQYQNRLPTQEELAEWFGNPANGVGCLGGWQDIVWIDFDAKNFESTDDLDEWVMDWLDLYELHNTWIEQTGSGGYRVAVKVIENPTFTNFAIEPEGEHKGEALGHGRFTVLAPSRHPNGKQYLNIRTTEPIEIQSLESIGIFPSKAELENQLKKVLRSQTPLVPSDAKDNPWDIRNFAQYIEGYCIEKEWIKVKCPQHNGVSNNSLHINASTGAYKCWGGCDTKLIYQRAKEKAVASGYQLPKKRDSLTNFDGNNKTFNSNQGDQQMTAAQRLAIESQDEETQIEAMKQAIKDWMVETDPFRRTAKENKLYGVFKLTKQKLEELARYLRTGATADARLPEAMTIAELFDSESEGLDFIVDEWILKDDNIIITGDPGAGKTLIAVDLTTELSKGGKWLNSPCEETRTLFISSDQRAKRTARYFRNRGIQKDNPNVIVVGETRKQGKWTVQQLDRLENWLDQHNPGVVVIDSVFATIAAPMGLEIKDERIGGYITQVNSLCNSKGATVIWIHHNNKAASSIGGTTGTNRSAGSFSIVSSNSQHWVLTKKNPKMSSDTSRILEIVKCRDIEPRTVEINFNPEDSSFAYIGLLGESAEQAQTRLSLKTRIQEYLLQKHSEGYEWIPSKAIREFLNTDSVYATLNRMADAGLVSERQNPEFKSTARQYMIPQSLRHKVNSQLEKEKRQAQEEEQESQKRETLASHCVPVNNLPSEKLGVSDINLSPGKLGFSESTLPLTGSLSNSSINNETVDTTGFEVTNISTNMPANISLTGINTQNAMLVDSNPCTEGVRGASNGELTSTNTVGGERQPSDVSQNVSSVTVEKKSEEDWTLTNVGVFRVGQTCNWISNSALETVACTIQKLSPRFAITSISDNPVPLEELHPSCE